MREAFLQLPLALRVGIAVTVAFALTQVEAAYEKHRAYAPVAAAETAAEEAGQPVTSLPFGVAEAWVGSHVAEEVVRERWTSGNTYYARAFTAMTPPVPEERLTVVDRCYAFPVTGEVRTRLRGTVYLARFCYSGELPAPGPISAEVRPVPS